MPDVTPNTFHISRHSGGPFHCAPRTRDGRPVSAGLLAHSSSASLPPSRLWIFVDPSVALRLRGSLLTVAGAAMACNLRTCVRRPTPCSLFTQCLIAPETDTVGHRDKIMGLIVKRLTARATKQLKGRSKNTTASARCGAQGPEQEDRYVSRSRSAHLRQRRPKMQRHPTAKSEVQPPYDCWSQERCPRACRLLVSYPQSSKHRLFVAIAVKINGPKSIML